MAINSALERGEDAGIVILGKRGTAKFQMTKLSGKLSIRTSFFSRRIRMFLLSSLFLKVCEFKSQYSPSGVKQKVRRGIQNVPYSPQQPHHQPVARTKVL
jgi:hypothetical protein